MTKNAQILMLKKEKSAYGGELLKTRKGRLRGRPLSTKDTMHVVLRSTKAVKEWSFLKKTKEIRAVIKKFSTRYGVKIISIAIVGNHIHIHLKLGNRYTYAPFIRATTSAIAMLITGASRWNPLRTEAHKQKSSAKTSNKFWDYRPYSRVVESYRAYLNLKDYIMINKYEGFGYDRDQAKFLIGWDRAKDTG